MHKSYVGGLVGLYILRKKVANDLKHDPNIYEIVEQKNDVLVCKMLDSAKSIECFESEILQKSDDAQCTKLMILRDLIFSYNESVMDAYNKHNRMRDAIVVLANDFPSNDFKV